MQSIAVVILLLLYGASALLLARRLTHGTAALSESNRLPLLLGTLGAALHALLLYEAVVLPGGLSLGFFNVLSVVAWLMTTMVLGASCFRPVENLGVVVLPVSGVIELARLILGTQTLHLTLTSPGLEAHVLLSLIAYSLLGIAAGQALLLSIQDRHLRNRQPGGFIRALPPLETMESLLFDIIGLGWLVLTLSLATGTPFLKDIFGQHLFHKTVLSVTGWVVFAVLLWGRWQFGWRGRTAIRWTLGGFGVLMMAYFGSKMVLELILRR